MAQDNFNVNDQIMRLLEQQGKTQIQPVLNTGLLSGTQQNFGDVLRNPDQAQVNAGIAGAAALLSGRDAGTALVNSASAFGNTRQQTYNNQLAANKVERETLKDRLASVVSVGNLQNSQKQLGLAQAKELRQGNEFDTTELRQSKEFAATEKRLNDALTIKQQLDNKKLGLDILKAGDIYEKVVGQDQYGGQLKDTVRRNPITNIETIISSQPSTTTTPARLATIKENKAKGLEGLRAGSDLFFEDNLDTIFGIFDWRAELGAATEGRVYGESTELKNKYNRFINNRVLDVVRLLAPVTDLDFSKLLSVMAPGTTFGSAKEARSWYTGDFIPKVLSEARNSGSAYIALEMAGQVLHPKMTTSEIGGVIGSLPSVEELRNIVGVNKEIWQGPDGSPVEGKAFTIPIIKAMAQQDGLTIDKFILQNNLTKVDLKGTNK